MSKKKAMTAAIEHSSKEAFAFFFSFFLGCIGMRHLSTLYTLEPADVVMVCMRAHLESLNVPSSIF